MLPFNDESKDPKEFELDEEIVGCPSRLKTQVHFLECHAQVFISSNFVLLKVKELTQAYLIPPNDFEYLTKRRTDEHAHL